MYMIPYFTVALFVLAGAGALGDLYCYFFMGRG